MAEDTELRITYGQVHVEWVIKNYFYHLDKILIRSPFFSFSHSKWHLIIYPDVNEDWIELYLRSQSAVECSIHCRIGIKRIDGSVLHALEGILYEESDIYGSKKFFRMSSLEDIMDTLSSNGSLTVFCTVRIGDNTTEAESQTTSKYDVPNLLQDLESLYLDGQHSDIKIRVKNKELMAHKCIIAARSKVFAAMFGHDTTEKSSGTIEVEDCDPDSFEDFIHYLYTGKLDVVSSSNAMSLYKTADKYDVENLKNGCVECMIRELSVDSICDVVCLATMYSESRLLTAATKFFATNFKTILQTTQWLGFLAENAALGNELLLKAVDKL